MRGLEHACKKQFRCARRDLVLKYSLLCYVRYICSFIQKERELDYDQVEKIGLRSFEQERGREKIKSLLCFDVLGWLSVVTLFGSNLANKQASQQASLFHPLVFTTYAHMHTNTVSECKVIAEMAFWDLLLLYYSSSTKLLLIVLQYVPYV